MAYAENISYYRKSGRKIKLATLNGFELVNPDDIIFFISEDRHAYVHLTLGREVLTSYSLKSLFSKLSQYEPLLQINRSTVINTKFLSGFDRIHGMCKLIAGNGTYEFQVSSGRFKEFDDL